MSRAGFSGLAIRTELVLIAFASGLGWFIALPETISVAYLVLVLATVFLVQSLIRDLFLLTAIRSGRLVIESQRKPAFCLESILGLTAVVTGLLMLLSGASSRVELNSTYWMLLIGLTMASCFLLRNTVVQWHPWAIYQDPNHLNFIVVRK